MMLDILTKVDENLAQSEKVCCVFKRRAKRQVSEACLQMT